MLKILPALALLWAAVAAPGADGPATFKVGEFTFTRPAGWEWIQSTQAMYKAHIKLTSLVNGKSVEVWFDDTIRGVDLDGKPMKGPEFLNIITNSFHSPVPMVATNVAGHKLTFVNTGSASERSKPHVSALHHPDARTVYAFIEGQEGNVVINFSGSSELVEVLKPDFLKMVETGAAGK